MRKFLSIVLSLSVLGSIFVVVPKVGAAAKYNYDYEIVNQSPYPSEADAGQIINVWIEVKNTGNMTWYNTGDRKVRLGAGSAFGSSNQPRDYISEFANSDWLSPNRPVAITDNGVVPGWNTKFQFNIKAPAVAGTYKAYFTPVVDGWTWMYDRGIYWEITVKGGSDNNNTNMANPASVNCVNKGGVSKIITQADGSQYGVCLLTYATIYEEWDFFNKGNSATNMYAKGLGNYIFEYVSQDPNPEVFAGEGLTAVNITLKNIGKSIWYKEGATHFRLGTSHPKDRVSQFKGALGSGCFTAENGQTYCTGALPLSDWLGSNRITMDETEVYPGQTTTFNILLKAPAGTAPGKYKEYFQPVVDGLGWLDDIGIYIEITVKADSVEPQNPSGSVVSPTTSLTLTPSGAVSVKSGTIYDFTVMANHSDGSSQNVTGMAVWGVNYGTGTGTMHTGIPGRFIAGGMGSCWVTASFDGKSTTSGLVTVTGL